MSISAQSVVRRVVETLQDKTSIRWPVAELVRYLNDGQREIALYRPDSMVTNATVELDPANSKQSIPANGSKLIEVIRNTDGTKRSIRLTSRSILDSQSPEWHSFPNPTNEIHHYMFDARDPKTFYVYPPAGDACSVELVYSSLPTDIQEPADDARYTAVVGNVSVPDIYGNILQDYILYRAYTKDSDYAGNGARAQAHYAAFAAALGIEIKSTIAVSPTTAAATAQA
jgi:hypothetical protein